MNRRARTFAIAVALTTAASAVYGVLAADGSPGGAVNGIFAGLPISLSILAFEAFVVDHPRGAGLRRRPFAVALLVRLVVWGAAIVASLAAMRFVLPWPGATDPYWFLGDMAFGFALLFVALPVTSIDRLLGPGNLLRILTGRYHRPREEERIFLFVDMEGSTRVAERLGNVAFLGDGINVAKRLETIARDRNARLVVSGDLIDRLSGERRRHLASPMGATAITGKTTPIRIFRVARSGAAA